MARTKVTARMSTTGPRPAFARRPSPASSNAIASSSSSAAPSAPPPSSDTAAPSRQAGKGKLQELLAKRKFYHLSALTPALREEYKDHPTLTVHFNDSHYYDKSMLDFPLHSDGKALVCVFENGNNRLKTSDLKKSEFVVWNPEALKDVAELRTKLERIDSKIVEARVKAGVGRSSSAVGVLGNGGGEENHAEASVERVVAMENGSTKGKEREVSGKSVEGAVVATEAAQAPAKSVLSEVVSHPSARRIVTEEPPETIIIDDSPDEEVAMSIENDASTADPPSKNGSSSEQKDQSSLAVNGDIVVEAEVTAPMEVDEAATRQNGTVAAMIVQNGAMREDNLTKNGKRPANAAVENDRLLETTENVEEPAKKKKQRRKKVLDSEESEAVVEANLKPVALKEMKIRPTRELVIPPIPPTVYGTALASRLNSANLSRTVVTLPARPTPTLSHASLPPRPLKPGLAPLLIESQSAGGSSASTSRAVSPLIADPAPTAEQDMMVRLEAMVNQKVEAMSKKLTTEFDAQIAQELKNSQQAQKAISEGVEQLLNAKVSMGIAHEELVEKCRTMEEVMMKRIEELEAEAEDRRAQYQATHQEITDLEAKLEERLATASEIEDKITVLDRKISPSLLSIGQLSKKQTTAAKEAKKLDATMQTQITRSTELSKLFGQLSASVEASQKRTDSEICELQTALEQNVQEMEERLSTAEEKFELAIADADELESKLQEGLVTIVSTVEGIAGSAFDQELVDIKQQISKVGSNSVRLDKALRKEVLAQLGKLDPSAVIAELDKKITTVQNQSVRASDLAGLDEKLQARYDEQKMSINWGCEVTREEMREKFVDLEEKIVKGGPSKELVKLGAEFQGVLESTTTSLIEGMEKRIAGVEEKLGRAVSANLVEFEAKVKHVAESTAEMGKETLGEMEKMMKLVEAIEKKLNSSSDSVGGKSKETEESVDSRMLAESGTAVAAASEGVVELEKKLSALEEKFTIVNEIQLAVNRQAERVQDISNHAVSNGQALNRLEGSTHDEKIACDNTASLVTALKTQLDSTDKLAAYQYKRLRERQDEKILLAEENIMRKVAKIGGRDERGAVKEVRREREAQRSLSPPPNPTIGSRAPAFQPLLVNTNSTSPPSTLTVPTSAHSPSCPTQSAVDLLRTEIVQLAHLSAAPCKLSAAVAEHTKHLQALSNRIDQNRNNQQPLSFQNQQPLGSQPSFLRLETRVTEAENAIRNIKHDISDDWDTSLERIQKGDDRVREEVEVLRKRLDAQDKARDPRTAVS